VAETPSFEDLCRSVADRYRAPADHYYVRAKLRIDPVSRALHELGAREPFGSVTDVACGRGQAALLLVAAGFATRVSGLDWDKEKVTHATQAASGLPHARFVQGDVRASPLEASDTVLLIDILHYLTRDEQDDLLVRAARAARGRVIVRDVDPDRGASSALTHGWEWVTTTFGYNRGARVSPRSFAEITAVLEAEGLFVTRQPCSAKAMSNELLVARTRRR
jgi:SAM-dependent methyltransferase